MINKKLKNSLAIIFLIEPDTKGNLITNQIEEIVISI